LKRLVVGVMAALAAACFAPLAGASFPGSNGKLAFVSDRDGTLEVYSMNPDGSAQTRLTDIRGVYDEAEFPRWSPDGQEILFSSGERIIYRINADGSALTALTSDASVVHEDPSWSPDGTKIAFASDRDGVLSIYSMNADGSSIQRLNSGGYNPVWSPDGTKIAYNDGTTIWVMNEDGSEQTRLTSPPLARDELPSWSPDGTTIAFDSSRSGNYEIYAMKADGQRITRLTNTSATNWGPVWSPDGKRIAFVSNRDGNNEIYVMNADGSGQTRVTNNSAIDWEPDWQPAPLGPVPPNDDFANAIVLTGQDATRIGDTNVGAGLETGEPTQVAGAPAGASVWYRWTAPASGRASVDTQFSGYDTLLAVYTGSGVGTLSEVASNDDAGTDYLTSTAGFEATAGTTYRIRVDGFAGDTGTIDLHLRETSGASPANDSFANAVSLNGRTAARTDDTNVGSSLETGEPAVIDGAPAGRSIWYRWTAPASGSVSIDTAGSDFDTLLGVYSGSTVDDLSEVAANDDAAADLGSEVDFEVDGGTTYWIRVDGYDGAAGTVDLHLTATTPPDAPTNVSATPGARQATVNWNTPGSDGGSPITGYELTVYAGGVTQRVEDLPVGTQTTVTGLTNGTTYTFRVAAVNAVGASPQSSDSNPVTPATAPAAPTGVFAQAGNASATLSWAAPADNGGSAITGYVITPYIGSAAQATTTVTAATSATVLGLGNGATYTFTVAAKNAIGTGAASTPSNAVTPVAPKSTVKCVVPNVKGKRLATAKHRIAARHCRTGTVKTARSKTVRKGEVISQRPKPGTRLRKGGKVNLVISRGKK
jgi:Fibronectin type III domain/WD40-like Beta Propeller Repeat/PASTA domain